MSLPRKLATTLAAGCALLTAGCGLSDPYAPRPRRPPVTAQAQTVTTADPVPERGGRIPAAARTNQQAGGGAASPPAALSAYAVLYVNWTAATLAANQRRLAELSIDQARAQALQAAASYRRDGTLRRSGVRNSGRLISLSPSLTTPGVWVLVSSEQTSGHGDYSGLPPTLHVTYAELTRTATGWVISRWAPQN